MKKVLLGVVVLLALGAGWWLLRGGDADATATRVSPEAAVLAEAKLRRLQEEKETVRLSDAELTSLLRYRLQDRIPGDLHSPAVAFQGDTVRMVGRFPSDQLPQLPELGRVTAFLPDTATVEVVGRLRALEPGRAALEVHRITFAEIPIPERLYPTALQRMGRRDEPGLPSNAYAFYLPEGVGGARVENGLLVLDPSP
jgi:hypothetical protein